MITNNHYYTRHYQSFAHTVCEIRELESIIDLFNHGCVCIIVHVNAPRGSQNNTRPKQNKHMRLPLLLLPGLILRCLSGLRLKVEDTVLKEHTPAHITPTALFSVNIDATEFSTSNGPQ